MSREFGVQRAGNIIGPPTKERLASLIRETIGYAKTDLSQDRLAEILLNMLGIMNTSSEITTVQLNYYGNVLTVTVNGVSASVNINPTTGSSGSTIYTYDAGGDVYVKATALGITALKVPGLVILTIPNNTTVLSARLHGSASDIDVNKAIVIRFDNIAGITNLNDMFPPTIAMYDRIFGTDPTFVVPYTYNISNSPQGQIIAVGNKTLSLKFINMDAYLNWGILLNF